MARCEGSATALNDQATTMVTCLNNYRAKDYFLYDEPARYQVTNFAVPLNDEIVEQCLALVHAILETKQDNIKESLTFILQERLLLLQDRLI